MMRAAEFTLFAGAALATHLGLWMGFEQAGSESQGATGDALISLNASSPSIAKLVETWDKPVTAQHQPPAPPQPVRTAALEAPRAPAPQEQTTPRTQQLPLPMQPRQTQDMPQIDTEVSRSPILERAPKTSKRPPVRPSKAQQARRAQKASGGTSGNTAGKARKRQDASLSKAARQSLMARWGGSIRNSIERRKRYPGGTSASGTALLRITITRGGRLAGVSVIRSSGSRVLDRAAVSAVQRAGYPRAPRGLTASQYKFNLPISFTR